MRFHSNIRKKKKSRLALCKPFSIALSHSNTVRNRTGYRTKSFVENCDQ
ncbi:hypothetical protein GDO81_005395 [Engystomops pustulosus]|uniref:Uncharacterized protein n=1 Tax=Engystomops pustulosus TaxID=76066 RepID=A0AAV7CN34_ENGPU|nr:hypothetical protein GDO81_024186 [Engystomops pustulosus]KAG8586505.1 hypothetical protein GDO81_005395 [Engystomops pustulosus]